MRQFEIAPAAIARVASVPLSSLSDLAEPALADQAEAAYDSRLSWSAFESSYEAALDATREHLWLLTANDKRFLVALAFANPHLAARVASLPRRSPRSKSRRQMDTTLYRYLARAAYRCQPFGLWSGVSLVSWGRETRVVNLRPVIKVEPDLHPFFKFARMLGNIPRYRPHGIWQINPSIGRQPDGSWVFWVRSDMGAIRRRVHPGSGIDAILGRLSDCDQSSFDAMLVAIEPCCASRESAYVTLTACANSGILVGGMQPPWRFQTAWEALDAIEAELLVEDRSVWRKARLRLASICLELEECADNLAFNSVCTGMEMATEVIRELGEDLDLPCPKLPKTPLRCDMRSPVEIQLGEDVRSRIESALDEYLRSQGNYGFGAELRRAVLDHYFPAGELECPLNAVREFSTGRAFDPTWEGLGQVLGAGSGFYARIAGWKDLLGGMAERVVAMGHDGIVSPPFGWLQLGITAPPGHSNQLVVHGVHDDLWGPYARHSSFWSNGSEMDELQAWIFHRLSEIERDCGVDLAELVAPYDFSPNVLARPPLGRALLSPWSCLPAALSLQGAHITRSDEDTALLRLPGAARPIAILNAASADVQSYDPIVQLLLTTSLAVYPCLGFQASSMVFAHELEAAHPSPEVVLPSGAIVRARRKVFSSGIVQEWLRATPARRFAEWSRLARRNQWPPLLIIRRQDGMALPVHRDSPLALSAMLTGAGSGFLTIESWSGEAWVDTGGQCFVAELSVPFLRHTHVWSHLGASPSGKRVSDECESG
jgi:hypothetical protein